MITMRRLKKLLARSLPFAIKLKIYETYFTQQYVYIFPFHHKLSIQSIHHWPILQYAAIILAEFLFSSEYSSILI